MKLTVKTVNKSGGGGAGQFDINVEDADTILQVKQKIQEAKSEYEADSCKLICAGKILQNDKTVTDSALKDGDFLVIIPGKKAAAPAAAPVAAAAPAAPAPATDAPPAPPAPTAAAPVSGAESEAAISNLVDMGFPRDQCVAALRASFGNPDRAVQFLFDGIPANEDEAMPPAPAGGNNAVAPPPAAGPPSAGFQGTAFPAMGGAAAPPAAGGADPLAALQQNPQQMQQMIQMMQQNPQMMQQVLAQLGQSNPELLQQIQQNPQALMQMLGAMGGQQGGMEGNPMAGGMPPAGGGIQIELSEADRAAVERLQQLGFPRAAVIQAYMACEKNEELAANFLFEMGEDY